MIKESHSEEVTPELTPKRQKEGQPWENEVCFLATSTECVATWFWLGWFDLVHLIGEKWYRINLLFSQFECS